MKKQGILLLLMLVSALALFGCTDTPAELPVSLAEAGTAELGDFTPLTQEKDGISYTLLGVNPDYVSAGKYAKPKAGYRFVTVKMDCRNNRDTAAEVSSLLMLSAVDDQGNEYPITITVTDLPATLDGTVAPDGVLEGYAAFEIPVTAKTLSLAVKPDLFSEEALVFPLY